MGARRLLWVTEQARVHSSALILVACTWMPTPIVGWIGEVASGVVEDGGKDDGRRPEEDAAERVKVNVTTGKYHPITTTGNTLLS